MKIEPLYICVNCERLCEVCIYQSLDAGDASGSVLRTIVASACCDDAADLTLPLPCESCKKENYPWRLDAKTGLCQECFDRPEMEGEKFEPMREGPRK